MTTPIRSTHRADTKFVSLRAGSASRGLSRPFLRTLALIACAATIPFATATEPGAALPPRAAILPAPLPAGDTAPAILELPLAPGPDVRAAAAGDGVFVVVAPAGAPGEPPALELARVTQRGVAQGPALRVRLAGTGTLASPPALAGDGRGGVALVALVRTGAGLVLRGAVASAQGDPPQVDTLAVLPDDVVAAGPAVSRSEGTWLLAWTESTGSRAWLRVARWSGTGPARATGLEPLATSTPPEFLAVAPGTEGLVVAVRGADGAGSPQAEIVTLPWDGARALSTGIVRLASASGPELAVRGTPPALLHESADGATLRLVERVPGLDTSRVLAETTGPGDWAALAGPGAGESVAALVRRRAGHDVARLELLLAREAAPPVRLASIPVGDGAHAPFVAVDDAFALAGWSEPSPDGTGRVVAVPIPLPEDGAADTTNDSVPDQNGADRRAVPVGGGASGTASLACGGDRYVDDTGDDSANDCMDSLNPCATISHAIAEACVGETVFVNEGDYFEDIVIDKQITVDALGSGVFTTVRGSNTTDVVTITAEGVVWDGVEVTGAPDFACLHIGSATATELHDLRIANAAFYGCAIGILVENTGSDPLKGFNRFVGIDVRDNVTDGTPDTGIGLLMRGGNGKLEFKSSFARNNENIGARIDSPQGTLTNDTIIITGVRFINNGFAANATDRVGLWVKDATGARIEGNLVQDQTGSDPLTEDGVGMRLENVTGPDFPCNDFINNDVGVEMIAGTNDLRVLHDNFANNQYAGLRIGAGSGSQVVVHETLFSGNALAIDHSGDGTLDATHNWWGAADGPASAGGSGDATQGAIDTGNFITRSVAPILVRRPVDTGWSSSVVSCNSTLQLGIDKAVDGDLVLVGEGDYREHVTWDTKLIDVEGIDGGLSCSPSVLDGKQSGGSHLPALTISNVSGVTLRQMTIRSAGEGTTCGQNTGDEIGLALDTVSNSTFTDLCLRENGVTEIRVYGDSDNNTFQDIDIDGAIRDHENNDVCGHRSREGILIDGGPTCEGGPGAVASGNVIDNVTMNFVARGVSLHFADGTQVRNSTISASPAPAWDAGTFAAAALVRLSDDVVIENNTLFAEGSNEGVRIAGRDSASCVTSRTDTARTVVRSNAFRDVAGAGVDLFKASGDPGAPVQADVSCNDFQRNAVGLLASAPGSGADANLVRNNDFQLNTVAVRNTGVQPLDARENWWNAADGPGGPGGGSGDPIDGAVTFAPYLVSSAVDDADNDTVTECAGDCDDTESTVGPGFAELCDGLDNDCDGSVDEDLPLFTWYLDADEDGFGDATSTIQVCDSSPPPGYADNPDDCNDGDPQTWPGAPEIVCDGVDQGCDGNADEAPDADADGYDVCDATDPGDGDGLAADCADDDITRNPGIPEASCDGIDNDCDGTVDTPGLVCADLDTPNLRFSAGSKSAMTWNTTLSANAYALYRGEIDPPRFSGYNHTCLAAELGTASAEDPATPAPGHAFYYLATGVAIDGPTGAFDDGPLGQDSAGATRPAAQGLACGARVYVDPDAAASAGTGLSWADAYTTVGLALKHTRGRRRALTVWMRGSVQDDPITLDGTGYRGLRVLGGFAGTETNAWQRDPATNVTSWRTIPAGTLLTLLEESAELDGLTIDAGQLGVRADLELGALVLRRIRASGLSDRLADVRAVGPGDARLVAEDVSHDGSGNGAIRAVAERATLGGRIRIADLGGGTDAALRLEARPVGGAATVDLEVTRVTVSGGQTGMVLGAHADDAGTLARQVSRVSSSLIHGTTGDAILVEAGGTFSTDTPASAIAAPWLTGNTLSDAGGAGVRVSAVRTDTSSSPAAHAVESRPELRDLLLTFHAGAAVEESADDAANGLIADPLLERCDLFGNASLYLDEGTTTLSTIGEVNALGSNIDNWDADPLYVDRALDDYHLAVGSPAIDRADKAAPGLPSEDRDGTARIKGAAPDTGAFEATP